LSNIAKESNVEVLCVVPGVEKLVTVQIGDEPDAMATFIRGDKAVTSNWGYGFVTFDPNRIVAMQMGREVMGAAINRRVDVWFEGLADCWSFGLPSGNFEDARAPNQSVRPDEAFKAWLEGDKTKTKFVFEKGSYKVAFDLRRAVCVRYMPLTRE
jgi:hypothetical protein